MMAKRVASVGLLAAALILAACNEETNAVTITGSGNLVEQEYDLSDFVRVDASHSFKVTLSQGESFMVWVRADDNLIEEVDVKRSGDTLQIGLKGDSYQLNDVTLEAEVILPVLAGVRLSGSSQGILTGFESETAFDAGLSGLSELQLELTAGDVQLDLSGSSQLAGNVVAGGKLTLEASGASEATLDGSATNGFDLDLSGSSILSGNLDLVGDVMAQLSGASRADVLGSGELGDVTLDVGGSSTFRMTNANTAGVTIEVSGDSTIELTGTGAGLTVEARGGSTVDLASFTVTDAQVKASGGSVVALNLSGKLDADASGSARISYQGDPTLGTIETSSGSSVGPQE